MAVDIENTEIVKLLLASDKIDVNAITKLEKKEGDEIKFKTKTALHFAVENSSKDIIKILLADDRIDVNVENEQGKKPIECTTKNEIIQLFNQKKIDHL